MRSVLKLLQVVCEDYDCNEEYEWLAGLTNSKELTT